MGCRLVTTAFVIVTSLRVGGLIPLW